MAGAKWLLPFIFPNITLIFKPTNPSDINRVFETAQLVLSVSAFLEKTVERNEEGILHWQG